MIYDDFGAQMKKEYDVFLFALAGRYLSAMAPGAEVTPKMVNDLKADVADLRDTYLSSASKSITAYVAELENGDSTEQSVTLMNELAMVTSQNISTLIGRMKGVHQDALKSVKNAHGGIGLLLQKKLATPEFSVETSSGRKYKAADYVRGMTRDFAYRLWLSARMEQISWTTDLATVSYDDPSHANYGLVFSISGDSTEYPSFASLERSIFHFNASAKVEMYVQA